MSAPIAVDYIAFSLLTVTNRWFFFSFFRGCEPLTGDDIAEVIVFAAGRRENVVIADTLVFPSHQVCLGYLFPLPHYAYRD